jgi:hypothetical protein
MNLEDIIRKKNNVNLGPREAVFFKALFREIDDKKEKKETSAKKFDETRDDDILLKRGREPRPKDINAVKEEEREPEEEEEGLPPMFQVNKFQVRRKEYSFILKLFDKFL